MMPKMDSVLSGLVKRPAKDWTEVEKDLFAKRVNELNFEGEVVILPRDHCFYCGDELTDNVLGANFQDGTNPLYGKKTGLVIPLCEGCNLAAGLTCNQQHSQN